jgi:hypothetical protein
VAQDEVLYEYVYEEEESSDTVEQGTEQVVVAKFIEVKDSYMKPTSSYNYSGIGFRNAIKSYEIHENFRSIKVGYRIVIITIVLLVVISFVIIVIDRTCFSLSPPHTSPVHLRT